MHYFRVSKWW